MRLFLAACLALAPVAALSQTPGLNRPHIATLKVGIYTTAVGQAWVDIDGGDLDNIGPSGRAPAATDLFYSVSIQNRDDADDLYLLLREDGGAGTATTDALTLAPGEAITLDVYGLGCTGIALQGEAAGTPVRVIVYAGPN